MINETIAESPSTDVKYLFYKYITFTEILHLFTVTVIYKPSWFVYHDKDIELCAPWECKVIRVQTLRLAAYYTWPKRLTTEKISFSNWWNRIVVICVTRTDRLITTESLNPLTAGAAYIRVFIFY